MEANKMEADRKEMDGRMEANWKGMEKKTMDRMKGDEEKINMDGNREVRENLNMPETDYAEDYGEVENRLAQGKADYQGQPIPDGMKEKVEEAIGRAEAEKGGQDMDDLKDRERTENDTNENGKEQGTKRKARRGFRFAAIAAAAAALLVILPNTGAGAAYAMGNLPVVGKLFQAVTFRDYTYDSGRFTANVEVPQIVVEDINGNGDNAAEANQNEEGAAGENTVDTGTEGSGTGEGASELDKTVEQINFDIDKVTDQLIQEFQESADLGESYGDLEIHHETVTDNERYFTLRLSVYQGAGSGTQFYKLYTIDKQTGKQVQLKDLFQEDSDYNQVLSEDIREQMRERMAEDESMTYWVDDTEVPEWNFQELKEDQNFYFDEDGNLVIVFDKYEVAPGYMGAQEFTIEKEVYEGLLK